MKGLVRADLMSLEQYAQQRVAFRSQVLAHKRDRHVEIGDHARLYFEDRLTIQYQIQEMLRIEKIFEVEEIEAELRAYNPLIPDGHNWKATFMLEYEDVEERRTALAQLRGIAERVWVQVGDNAQIFATADEDMGRDNDDKTASVHFLRFDLPAVAIADARAGSAIAAGIDHPYYHSTVTVSEAVRQALVADLS
ncbi:MAG: DUF3501 family protein [Acidiferrobacter sp.]